MNRRDRNDRGAERGELGAVVPDRAIYGAAPILRRIVKAAGTVPCGVNHISTKNSSPAKYRSPIWKNLRDGFAETVSFWHLDENAVLDNSKAHLYASCYVDWDNDELILSRRQLAADDGGMEAMDAALERLQNLL